MVDAAAPEAGPLDEREEAEDVVAREAAVADEVADVDVADQGVAAATEVAAFELKHYAES